MSKYNQLKFLKKTKARTHHVCHKCAQQILPAKHYYREHIEDKFLHSLHPKKYCSVCYEKYGEDSLIKNLNTKKQ